ncbi:MAG: hypothetical protein ACXVEF_20315 [Polyangiales bacterium]
MAATEDAALRARRPTQGPREAIELEGVLINQSEEPTEVIVFPAYLSLVARGLAHRPRPPQVPPPPTRFVIEARERISFRSMLLFQDYFLTPGQRVEIEWSFTYWNEPLPRGTFEIVVPSP